MKNTKSNRGKFTPLQKKIILAQSAAADGDPAVAITAIDEARLLKPSAAVCKLLEKARGELDCGIPEAGEAYLDDALDESKLTCTPAVAAGELEAKFAAGWQKSVEAGSVRGETDGGTFTTGPWLYSGNIHCDDEMADHAIITKMDECETVALVFGKTPEEIDANARLIASAPDLLAALENVAAWIGCNVFSAEVNHLQELRKIHKVIARAHGEK